MKYWITYLIAAALSYSVIAYNKPVVEYTTKGIWLPINNKRTPLITPRTDPASQKLGWINLELHAKTPSLKKQHEIIRAAENLAKKMGGKKISNTQLIYIPANKNFGELARYSLHTIAIKTPGTPL